MSFTKEKRIVLIRHVKNSYSDISSAPINDKSEKIIYEGGEYFITPSHFFSEKHDIYLFPFLYNEDRSPWEYANLFLFSAAQDGNKGYSNSDAIRQKASLLIDYKIYCETNEIDLYNFNGRKPRRPTYRYFFELLQQVNDGKLPRKKLNQKTKVVYDFYNYLSEQKNSSIDMEKVDSIKSIQRRFHNSHGGIYTLETEKRGQSLPVCQASSPVKVSYVREYGEELRPLRQLELDELFDALETDVFSMDERLIHYIALHTGARKQSILTMRMKHLKLFTSEKLLNDGTYKVNAGPGTGIDTKYNKPQALYFPEALAKQIRTYAFSQKAQNRRRKFIEKNGKILSEEDTYLFISSHGNAHYLAKSDPSFISTKSRPQGRNTFSLGKKLSKVVSDKFPSDYVFHWLRATYALHYYKFLQPLFAKGYISDNDIISMVQKRLHHSDRDTTLGYLKLFESIDDRLKAQQLYEERVFELYGSTSEKK